jgi:hypothetical protein
MSESAFTFRRQSTMKTLTRWERRQRMEMCTCSTRRLSHQRHSRVVTSKVANILMNPSQGHRLVLQPHIPSDYPVSSVQEALKDRID